MDNFTSYGEDTPDSSGDESESSYERRNHYNFRPRKSSSSSHRSTPITRRSATIAPSPLRRRGNTSTSRTAQTRPKRARPRRGSTQTTSSISSTDLVKGSAGFAYDILGIVVWVVRKPLAWALALGLLYTLCGMLWIWARNSMFIALSPVCLIPGISGLELPFCKDTSRRAVGPDWGWGGRGEPKISGGDFPNLINLQTSFEALLEDSVSGTIMARDLKNSEIAVRDLNSLVKHSNLECRCESPWPHTRCTH